MATSKSLTKLGRGMTTSVLHIDDSPWSEDYRQLDTHAFGALLDMLRPKVTSISVHYRTDPLGRRAEITGDGVLIHTVEKMEMREDEFQEHVSEMVEFYRNPPFLWPRCRGDVARYLGASIHDKAFHKWFDRMVERTK